MKENENELRCGYVFYSSSDAPNRNELFVSTEEYDRIPVSKKNLFRLCHVEELFLMLTNALVDFNGALFRQGSKYMVGGSCDNLESSMNRVEVNQKAANYLTALEMYLEFVRPTNDDAERYFEINFSLCDDERILDAKCIRNYMQHVGCAPLTMGYSEWLCGDAIALTAMRSEIELDGIDLEDGRLHKGTVNALSDMRKLKGKNLDSYELLNRAYDAIKIVHCAVRASCFYRKVFQDDMMFLKRFIDAHRSKRLFLVRRADDPDRDGCIGSIPFFGDRQVEFVEYMNKAYSCAPERTSGYFTNAPTAFVNRVTKWDRDQYFRKAENQKKFFTGSDNQEKGRGKTNNEL